MVIGDMAEPEGDFDKEVDVILTTKEYDDLEKISREDMRSYIDVFRWLLREEIKRRGCAKPTLPESAPQVIIQPWWPMPVEPWKPWVIKTEPSWKYEIVCGG